MITSPQGMNEYLNMPEETAAALNNGWLLATRDEDGYFYIVDSEKGYDYLRGCNVCPRDVDAVLYEKRKLPGM